VAESIEASLVLIEEHSREIATQRKLEAKDEIKQEMRDELATKEDLANLRSELKDDIASLRTELKGDIASLRSELKDDISSLRTEFVRMEARLDRKFTILWLVTLFVIVFLNHEKRGHHLASPCQ